MDLRQIGWNETLDGQFRPHAESGHEPARVAREDKGVYGVLCEHGERTAEASGRLRHEAMSRGELPAVGDWVAVRWGPGDERGVIEAVLPRRSAFTRKAAGARTEDQVVAANVDTAFLVSGLDGNFNLGRIERYLTLAWTSGATPAIVLNKADLCDDVSERLLETGAVALGTPVHAVSALTGEGLDELAAYLAADKTAAFLGSSGVGKSSLINRILGEDRLKTYAVREGDQRGRHTTTWRELIPLAGGGALIDTPGMRELQLWADEEDVADSYADIEELAEECRFRDCVHRSEPDCAVREAIENGGLSRRRFENYGKMRREAARLARRQTQKIDRDAKARSRQISLWSRRRDKEVW